MTCYARGMAERTSAYEAARAEGRAALRERLVRVAGEILERSGVGGLSMRPLARAAGCSTMVFYTEFTNKDGLLSAIAANAARHLLEAVETVSDVDPVAHRRLVAHAYLDAAFTRPEHYRVLFRPAPAAAAGEASRALVTEVRQGVLAALAAEPMAAGLGLWCSLHGAASLVLASQLSAEEAREAIDAEVDASAQW
jgi:AcrR family transcriptional regulator